MKHSWKLNRNGSNQSYQLALMAIENLLDDHYNIVANGRGDPNTQPQVKCCIMFNGLCPNEHEAFFLPSELRKAEDTFETCDTGGKTYNKIVMACLIILKYYLEDDIVLRSDCGPEQWKLALSLLDLDIQHLEINNEDYL